MNIQIVVSIVGILWIITVVIAGVIITKRRKPHQQPTEWIPGFKEDMVASIKHAVEMQEQEEQEEYHEGYEAGVKYALEMLDKHILPEPPKP